MEKPGQHLVEQTILWVGTTVLHIGLLVLGGPHTQTPPQMQVGSVCAESVIFQIEVFTVFYAPLPGPGHVSARSAFKFQHLTTFVPEMSWEEEPHTSPLWSEIGLWSYSDLWCFSTSSFMSQEDTRWSAAPSGRHQEQPLSQGNERLPCFCPSCAKRSCHSRRWVVGSLQSTTESGCMYPRVWRRQLAITYLFSFLLNLYAFSSMLSWMPWKPFSFDWQVLTVSGFK